MHIAMGRPPTHPNRLLLALSDEFLAKLDAWRAKQPGVPNRSEALRRAAEIGFQAGKGKPRLKSEAIDQLVELYKRKPRKPRR
jgi:metal-responsive CopG/Arc/MetJ family transcriptional regulator